MVNEDDYDSISRAHTILPGTSYSISKNMARNSPGSIYQKSHSMSKPSRF